MTIYKKVFSHKESPTEKGGYTTDEGFLFFYEGHWHKDKDCKLKHHVPTPIFWMKPCNFSSILNSGLITDGEIITRYLANNSEASFMKDKIAPTESSRNLGVFLSDLSEKISRLKELVK